MAGVDKTGGVGGPIAPITPDEEPNPIEGGRGSHKGLSVETVEGEKHIPPSNAPDALTPPKKLAEFESVSLVEVAEPKVVLPSAEQKQGASQGDHEEVLKARLVNEQATKVQIERARKTKPWIKLEKIAKTKGKGQVSEKNFKQLLKALDKKSIEKNADLKLMVMFAGDKFASSEFSPEQMQRYMRLLLDKYVNVKANEQAGAAVKTLAPSGASRTGFHSEPLRASSSVQFAELVATTRHRLEHVDASDKDSGVAHNYKRDFPLETFGWDEIDFEDLSRRVDTKILEALTKKFNEALVRESGGRRKVKLKPEFQTKLEEGIHRSLDEFVDSQLGQAQSRVSSTLYDDTSVRDREDLIKRKVEERKQQLIDVLEKRLGEGVVKGASVLSTEELVGHKITQWVKAEEEKLRQRSE